MIFITLFAAAFLIFDSPSQAQSTAPNGSFSYTPMEAIPGQGAAVPTDFYTYITSIYKFGIGAVGIAALLMITIGGYMYLTSAGNNAAMQNAKDIITDSIVGVLLALGSYLLLYFINPDLVRLKPLTPSSTTAPTTSNPAGAGLGQPVSQIGASCSGATSDKTNYCGTTSCSKTCNLSQYDSLINQYETSIVPAKIIKAIICRESDGNPNAQNANSCGLMQVNTDRGTDCVGNTTGNLFQPEINIKAGVKKLTEKYNSAANRAYTNISHYQMAFASYNCCGNGENPNDPSRDCGKDVPKWACPINPGIGRFNMCAVKNYACDVEACAAKY